MQYIDIHTHTINTSASLSIFNHRLSNNTRNITPDGDISLGIHPWHTKDISPETIAEIRLLVNESNVIAIGECGLDRLRGADIAIQKDIFYIQAELANKVNKPLIIHCVKAFPEIISLYKKIKPCNPWIIHGFNQNIQIAKELLKHGIHLSFGAQLMNARSNASKIFSEIEKEYIFVETDDSKTDIRDIYRKAAELRNISLSEFEEIIRSNYKKCFKNE